MPSGPGRKPIYNSGDVLGGFEIVERVYEGRVTSHFIMMCLKCGSHVTRINPMTARKHCRKCHFEGRKLPRKCRYCSTEDLAKFGHAATECMGCERRRLRNGLCECGRVRYNCRACECGIPASRPLNEWKTKAFIRGKRKSPGC